MADFKAPKPALQSLTEIQKKRHSSPLSSVPSAAEMATQRDVALVDSPPKPQNTSKFSSSFIYDPSEKLITCNSETKTTVPRRSLAPASHAHTRTPSKVKYVAPPPVPALRIVKRANADAKPQPHRRTSSIPNIGGSSLATAGRPSISSARPPLPPMPVEQKPVHKPTLQGVQRPRPSKAATVAAPPKTTYSFASKIIKPAETGSVDGPSVIGANAKSRLGRPTSTVDSSVPSKTNNAAPSRLPIASAAVASSTGLRQPSRFGYGGAAPGGASSALPKPSSSTAGAGMSRLPAPGSTRTIGKIGVSAPATRMGGWHV
jgi:hypothetical protein